MEELGALLALAQEANAQLGDIKSTATTSLSAIATATTGFENGRHGHGLKGECGAHVHKEAGRNNGSECLEEKSRSPRNPTHDQGAVAKVQRQKVRQVLLYERSNWSRHLDKTKNLGGQRYRKNFPRKTKRGAQTET